MPLVEREINMQKPNVIFIAGERQHAGKTTTSLVIISALSKFMDPKDIGYFKPVGQEMVTLPNGEKIDKDVLIIKQFTVTLNFIPKINLFKRVPNQSLIA